MTMNEHDEALLSDLLDGRLPEHEARALRERFGADPELDAAWEELQRIRGLLRRPDEVRAPADFLEKVRERVASERIAATDTEAAWAARARDGNPTGHRLALLALPLSAAAALLIGLVVADRLESRPPVALESAGPPVESASAPDDLPGEAQDTWADGRAAEGVAAGEAPAPAPAPLPPPRGVVPGGGAAPLGPGDAVPAGLRRPTDEVRPRAPAPDAAAARPAAPRLVFALATPTREGGTTSLARLLEGRLEASGPDAWRIVGAPAERSETDARPMAAEAPMVLVHLATEALDPVRIDLDGRKVYDGMTLVLSPDQAERLGTAAREHEAARSKTARSPAEAPTSPAPVTEAAKDKTESARPVRVRIWFVR